MYYQHLKNYTHMLFPRGSSHGHFTLLCCSTETNCLNCLWKYDSTSSNGCLMFIWICIFFNLYSFPPLKIDIQGHSRCPQPCQANTGLYLYTCVSVSLCTHQPSQQETAKHAHHCHTHDEPWPSLSIRSGRRWLRKHSGSTWMHHACFFVRLEHVPPHICSTDSQGQLVNLSSPTLMRVKSVLSSIPHLFCPPRFSQSFSSASIFNQLSSIEGMRGLFSAFSLTHYLAADSHSLLIL